MNLAPSHRDSPPTESFNATRRTMLRPTLNATFSTTLGTAFNATVDAARSLP